MDMVLRATLSSQEKVEGKRFSGRRKTVQSRLLRISCPENSIRI
jgi:hypothetical protein